MAAEDDVNESVQANLPFIKNVNIARKKLTIHISFEDEHKSIRCDSWWILKELFEKVH